MKTAPESTMDMMLSPFDIALLEHQKQAQMQKTPMKSQATTFSEISSNEKKSKTESQQSYVRSSITYLRNMLQKGHSDQWTGPIESKEYYSLMYYKYDVDSYRRLCNNYEDIDNGHLSSQRERDANDDCYSNENSNNDDDTDDIDLEINRYINNMSITEQQNFRYCIRMIILLLIGGSIIATICIFFILH